MTQPPKHPHLPSGHKALDALAKELSKEGQHCRTCGRSLTGPRDGDNPRGECEACYRVTVEQER